MNGLEEVAWSDQLFRNARTVGGLNWKTVSVQKAYNKKEEKNMDNIWKK